ncbi:hypothetical protein PHLCEN_2v3542 [Hermanssonia centrifuga]|uniref:Uncharacterized protein n=1 Tax=Hermanssonia centrifuga TaxID=98765 RepID=A0A1U7K663_9APHY|nr:hypothetical protein PHLCEN_2v3542 [Hermanssonia centrifuga]
MSTYTHVPFSSLHNRPGLISLAEARKNPTIVYRSLEYLHGGEPKVVRPKVTVAEPLPRLQSGLRLIPLSVAASRKDIKYRREGFEMMESRRHLLAVRLDRD